MNDGVRRSLLAAKIARMQAEDEREAARSAALGSQGAGPQGSGPGWGTASEGSSSERPSHAEMPVGRSVLDMLIQQAASNAPSQDGAGRS